MNHRKKNEKKCEYSFCRCASCIGESARAQWFRHSDGWQSGSSTMGSAASSSAPGYGGGHKGPWDSLPSLRHEGSLNDSGYKSNRTDSLEHRYVMISSVSFNHSAPNVQYTGESHRTTRCASTTYRSPTMSYLGEKFSKDQSEEFCKLWEKQ